MNRQIGERPHKTAQSTMYVVFRGKLLVKQNEFTVNDVPEVFNFIKRKGLIVRKEKK